MKKTIGFFMILGCVWLYAQAFHPYKVKSGKIMYEKLKYSIHTKMKVDSKGHMQGSRELVPYVAERTTYYWDDYGNVAFEESWQVSKFGGKPLEKPVKKYEQLWKGDKRYYHSIKVNRTSIDPWHERNACFKDEKLCEMSGWLEILYYPHFDKRGSDTIAGKSVDVYKVDEGTDLYVWKQIVLRDALYSEKKKSGKYVRSDIDSEKVATKVETDIALPHSIFNPKWVQEK